jgi:hypothetical protein
MKVSGQTHASDTLALGKNPHFTLRRKLRGPQNLSGRLEKRQILVFVGIRTIHFSALDLVNKLTTLRSKIAVNLLSSLFPVLMRVDQI